MKEILAIIGLLALIIVIANWKKIFPSTASSTPSPDEITCEFINDKGEKVILKGSSKDPEFVKMCESHKNTNQPVSLPNYSGYYYPYQYYYGYPYRYYYYPYYYTFQRRII